MPGMTLRQGTTGGTLSSPTVSTKLARIAEQSKRDATWVFTTLAHLMDEDFLTEAFHQLRKRRGGGH